VALIFFVALVAVIACLVDEFRQLILGEDTFDLASAIVPAARSLDDPAC
jgi:hypothetical protein